MFHRKLVGDITDWIRLHPRQIMSANRLVIAGTLADTMI